ncbi:MAG: hypothetical protein MN733_01960, partial [Nitrososphaera sp.]|nr:hypothetical protein [Nitrososphaera sp.]
MATDYFVGGEWNFVCDECSVKLKSSKARHRWDGAIVCPHCWEPRNSQDFVRGVEDDQSIPWSRPGGPDFFVEDTPGISTTTVTVPAENGVGGGSFT